MLQPIETPSASDAPRAAAYIGSSSRIRAEPKTVMAAPVPARATNPVTNSLVIRRTRQGSLWTNASAASRSCLLQFSSSSSCVGLRSLAAALSVGLGIMRGSRAPFCCGCSGLRVMVVSCPGPCSLLTLEEGLQILRLPLPLAPQVVDRDHHAGIARVRPWPLVFPLWPLPAPLAQLLDE